MTRIRANDSRPSSVRATAPPKRKLLLASSLLLLVLAVSSMFTPLLMQRGISAWLRYEAHRSGLRISFGQIRARFLRPVEILDLRITRAGLRGEHFEIKSPRTEAGLKFAAFFGQPQTPHLLRSLRIEHASIFLRGRAPATISTIDWSAVARILPDQFDISADQIVLDQQVARLELHDARVSGGKGRSGGIFIGALEVRAPFLQTHFADLRGISRWDGDRLTLGSLRLLDGLTIDSVVLDLTRLRASRIAAEVGASIFGGSIRANIATEPAEQTRIWEGAASASGISLPQVAAALGLTEKVRGSLRASKITFRGDPRDFLRASGSIWTELTGFSWRERAADVIMLGANFYGRAIQLQELYIKQRSNELTVSGETAIGRDWLNPDFRGDISAAIKDLSQFAELLGQPADAFAGKVAARGRIHAHENNVDGDLVLTGDALSIFRKPIDSLTAKINVDSTRLHLEQLEVKKGEDFVHGSGRLDLAQKRTFDFAVEGRAQDMSGYGLEVPLLGRLIGPLEGKFDATGDETSGGATLSATFNQLSWSARARWQDKRINVDLLKLETKEASAQFSGTIDFPDAGKVRADFTPATDLHLGTSPSEIACLRGVEIRRGEDGVPFSRIQLSEGILELSDSSTAMTQSFQLCSDDQQAGPLKIIVPGSATPPQAP